MGLQINVAGVWKSPDPKINVAGTWKTPDTVSINVAGTWKEVWSSGPTVNIFSNGRTNYRYGATCYAGEYFLTAGTEYEYTSTGGGFLMGTWLTSGASSEVWVSYVRTAGTQTIFNGTSGSTRYQLSSSRYFNITALPGQYKTITATFYMHDAASGGNLLDTSLSSGFVAEAESDACPLCCFTPDTLITLASGLQVPISQVREDDSILVFNPETGENDGALPGEVIVRHDVPIFKISFSDGRTIHASPDHPFHTDEGPKSVGSFTEYKGVYDTTRLDVGDNVAEIGGGWLKVTNIQRVRREPVVYTFGTSLFYANGLLVY